MVPCARQRNRGSHECRDQHDDHASKNIDGVVCTNSEPPQGNQHGTDRKGGDPSWVEPPQCRGEGRDQQGMVRRKAVVSGYGHERHRMIDHVWTWVIDERASDPCQEDSSDHHATNSCDRGKREAGETFEATVRRELLEETGWVPRDLTPVGFFHFHHISSRPDDYSYPYPDFIHMIYRGEAEAYKPEGRIADDHEEVVGLVPIEDASHMPGDVRGRWHLQQCISDPITHPEFITGSTKQNNDYVSYN